MANSSYVTMHLDDATIARLISLYIDYQQTPPNEYISHFFKSKEVTVSVYFKKTKEG